MALDPPVAASVVAVVDPDACGDISIKVFSAAKFGGVCVVDRLIAGRYAARPNGIGVSSCPTGG